jgi:hypothetical protein
VRLKGAVTPRGTPGPGTSLTPGVRSDSIPVRSGHDIDIDYILLVGHFDLATGSWRKHLEQHAHRVVSKLMFTPR